VEEEASGVKDPDASGSSTDHAKTQERIEEESAQQDSDRRKEQARQRYEMQERHGKTESKEACKNHGGKERKRIEQGPLNIKRAKVVERRGEKRKEDLQAAASEEKRQKEASSTGPLAATSDVRSAEKINEEECKVLMLEGAGLTGGSGFEMQAQKFGLTGGDVMELSSKWDFRKDSHREWAEKLISDVKPMLLVVRTVDNIFSSLHNISKWTERKQQRWDEEQRSLEFLAKMYAKQIEEGRLFLHAQPVGSRSWGQPAIQSIQRDRRVRTTVSDLCMFGAAARSRTATGRAPTQRPTRLMTNSEVLLKEVRRRCAGGHKHQSLAGGRATREEFPEEFDRAVCRAVIKEKRERNMQLRALTEVNLKALKGHMPDKEAFHERKEAQEISKALAWDDLTGMRLDAQMVIEARRKEMEYVRKKPVWVKIPRSLAVQKGWKIVKTRWIDINKGDNETPLYRSRVVGKEFNDEAMDGLFAGTPPLEALRYLVHDVATVDDGGEGGDKVLMINDVARAFFEAKATRKVCIELPAEDLTEEDIKADRVGLLEMSLYGTRDAAMNWQEEVAREMKRWGFQRGIYNPCLYYHPQLQIRTLVHGDDFVSAGRRSSINELKARLQNRFEVKTKVIGMGQGEDREGRVLNRVVRVGGEGWEYEPDQRHADIVVESLGLGSANATTLPGEDEKKWEEEENNELLDAAKAARFRSIAARVNYLAADRPDLMYSAKEVCRHMASPTTGGWKMLKRLGRYLAGHSRSVMKYPWQGKEEECEGYTDSDWAGCRRSGKSTSGGALMIGRHFIKGWSRTQNSVTLSSAEAELVAMVKLSSELLGVLSMMKDLGTEGRGVVYADSSAALAISKRRGSGKLRHINVALLWIQEKDGKEQLKYEKVKGTDNPADLMTKYVSSQKMAKYLEMLGLHFEEGRAKESLKMQSGDAVRGRGVIT